VTAPSSPTSPTEALTERQAAFVRAYLECGDATRAAEMAGYGGANATKHSLAVAGHKVLKVAKVRAAIDEARAVPVAKQARARPRAQARGAAMTAVAAAAEAAQATEEELGPEALPRLAARGVRVTTDEGFSAEQELRDLARATAVHPSAKVAALKPLLSLQRERERAVAGADPLEALRARTSRAIVEMQRRERETGCCARCRRPFADREEDGR
jgi:hypothetical protein